ncbi:MAG: TonB-dependent receptor plug domain-containing protein [Exilibacterium sp.]
MPAQNLADSLLEFALQSGITVIVDDKLIKNYRSSPVIGVYDLERAAENLLANTPLSVRSRVNSKTMVIMPKAPATRDEVASTIDQEASADKLIEEILVKGVSYPFQCNTITSSQLHSGISTFDSARFLSVLPEQLAVDQQSLEVTDLLRNSSSITPADGLADSNDDFYIRGFPRHALYVDGFRFDNTTGTKIPTALIERVEILKGPSTLSVGDIP